jgi:hypothetical protein
MRILAIDPGTDKSGWLLLDCLANRIVGFGHDANDDVLFEIPQRFGLESYSKDQLAIEMIASQGMAVGKETFRTVWWTGRFAEAWRRATSALPIEVYRNDVKVHLCNSVRAKDKNIRQALIDMYGGEGGEAVAIGRKATPGPLYGVSSHVWQALGVAITARDRLLARAAA